MPSATLIGFTAILMWSLLSLLTVASGTVPPFQLAAMTFAIGGGIGAATWLVRPGAARALKQPWPVWALGVGGLFGYHALYFLALRLAPPAEAQLVSYLWPVLIVLLSALLPGERLARASRRRRADRACRHRAAVRGRGISLRQCASAGLRRGLRRGLHLGDLFGRLAPLCRCAERRGRGVLSCDGGAGRDLAHGVRADALAGDVSANGSRSWRSASGRSARRSMSGTSA